jgi:hypothetical protein
MRLTMGTGERRDRGRGILLALAASLVPACMEGDPAFDSGAGRYDAVLDPDAPFTIAVLPDTQSYAQSYPPIFERQAAWLAGAVEELNLHFVVHVGDVVEHPRTRVEWDVADRSLGALEGRVPFAIAPGNHDYAQYIEDDPRTTLIHEYFPPGVFEAMPTFGGFFPQPGRIDNSFHTFAAGGASWLVLALEFAPRDAVLEWANQVLEAHPDHLAVIATHAYLYNDDTRYDWERYGEAQRHSPRWPAYRVSSSPEGANDGEQIWQKVIARHANVVAVVSGHVLGDGLGYQRSTGAGEVHEMLANYQHTEEGGAGFLRLLRVDVAAGQIGVTTYSPWRDAHKRDPDNEFVLDISSHLPR